MGGTKITEWQHQEVEGIIGEDDGWFHLDLTFDFFWFGHTERVITIGTNGVLTFGQDQLVNGASEPVPCEGTRSCPGDLGVSSGLADGIIAPFWTDLTTQDSPDGMGVHYQIIPAADPSLIAFNKLIVEYTVAGYNTYSHHLDAGTSVWSDPAALCQFEVILAGDGTVTMQYLAMPMETGSWSQESIGFEDKTGAMGVQISYGLIPGTGAAYTIPPSCHVAAGTMVDSCCSSQICQCENLECQIQTDFGYEWVDIINPGFYGAGTRISDWTNNADDGWFHVDLPFDFNWFGAIERTITIGTNGVLTFGQDQLPYGDSEPVPCQWSSSGGQGDGGNGCVTFNPDGSVPCYSSTQGNCAFPFTYNGETYNQCTSVDYGDTLWCSFALEYSDVAGYGECDCDGSADTGGHYGVEMNGLIAVFWADLNPGGTTLAGEGVYYQTVLSSDPRAAAWNKLIVEYNVPVWNGAPGDLFHFEAILSGDGSVLLQYKDLPRSTGSWSDESIGFEDRSGRQGAQISYGTVPPPESAYQIPPACHVQVGESSCCSSQLCQCEGIECTVVTDFDFSWVDLIDTGSGTRIEDWENNADDGWFHLDLHFDFNWFGGIEHRVTIGTNGLLTFGPRTTFRIMR